MTQGRVEEEADPIGRHRIRWTRLAAEAVAIIASILLAFAVDAAWSRHQDSREEEFLRTRLTEELQGNVRGVEYSSQAMASLQAQAQAMVDLLASAADGETVSVPDELIASLFFNPELSSLETATVDGMEATGRIGLFEDPEVSERVAVWNARRAAAALRQQELRDHFNDRILRYLSAETEIASFVELRDPFRDAVGGDPEFPWLGIEGRTELRNSRPLRNLVLERVLFLSAARIQVEMAGRALQNLLEAVKGSDV